MRDAFIRTLCDLAERRDDVFLVTGDLGFSVVEPYARRYAARFLNAGIAEQDMVGIAVGLSREGYTVFVYSIGNFPTLRCMEQVRYDVCYHRANVKIVAVGAGYAYGPLGASHHATEDLGMLRTIPGLIVAAPGDPVEVGAVTEFLSKTRAPGYMRLNKAGEPAVHEKPLSFESARAVEVIRGRDTVVVTTGAVLAEAARTIREAKLGWGLVSFPFVKPLDHEMLANLGAAYRRLVTVEEHQLSGGFGSAVLEGLNDLCRGGRLRQNPEVERIGIPDRFADFAGSQSYLRSVMGMDLQSRFRDLESGIDPGAGSGRERPRHGS